MAAIPPRQNRADPSDDGDLFDRSPIVGQTATHLERSLGPSCLLSLIMVFLLLVAFRRLLQLPIPALLLGAGVVWVLILTLLVRWRPPRPVDEDDW